MQEIHITVSNLDEIIGSVIIGTTVGIIVGFTVVRIIKLLFSGS